MYRSVGPAASFMRTCPLLTGAVHTKSVFYWGAKPVGRAFFVPHCRYRAGCIGRPRLPPSPTKSRQSHGTEDAPGMVRRGRQKLKPAGPRGNPGEPQLLELMQAAVVVSTPLPL